MTRERTLLHEQLRRVDQVENEKLMLVAENAAFRAQGRILVEEIVRLAADLNRERARMDWLAAQRGVTIERTADGRRLIVFPDDSAGQVYHAGTLRSAIDRAGGEG